MNRSLLPWSLGVFAAFAFSGLTARADTHLSTTEGTDKMNQAPGRNRTECVLDIVREGDVMHFTLRTKVASADMKLPASQFPLNGGYLVPPTKRDVWGNDMGTFASYVRGDNTLKISDETSNLIRTSHSRLDLTFFAVAPDLSNIHLVHLAEMQTSINGNFEVKSWVECRF